MEKLQSAPCSLTLADALRSPNRCSSLFVELALAAGVRALRQVGPVEAAGRLTVDPSAALPRRWRVDAHESTRLELRRMLEGEPQGRESAGVAAALDAAVADLRDGPKYRAEVSLTWCIRFATRLEELRRVWERHRGDWHAFLAREHPLFTHPYVNGLVRVWDSIRMSPDPRLGELMPYALWLATRRAPPGSNRVPKPLAAGTRPERAALVRRLRETRSKLRERARAAIVKREREARGEPVPGADPQPLTAPPEGIVAAIAELAVFLERKPSNALPADSPSRAAAAEELARQVWRLLAYPDPAHILERDLSPALERARSDQERRL